MAYTPELSEKYSAILRRIAWGLQSPMTETLNSIIDLTVKRIDKNTICHNCKDNTLCESCVFNQ